MPGHLFVVRSDLTQITCDTWLVPSDVSCTVEKPWPAALPSALRKRAAISHLAPAGYGRDRHVFPLPVRRRAPVPFITNVGGVAIADLPARVIEFLDASFERVHESTIPGRTLPLFAFPSVGTRHGGWEKSHGDVTRAVVAKASEWVSKNEADAVLVAWTPQAFSAAQAARRRLGLDSDLPKTVAQRAVNLGRKASLGQLVLFMGAGLGYPAGLPLWGGLLDALAKDAGVNPDKVLELRKLDARDAARIIESRLDGQHALLGDAIARHMKARRFGLSTALLASLPVSETVTTNYDTLFERATKAAHRELTVLPYDPPHGDRWLLKLHGTVDPKHRRDIVLTRGDYLRYADRRAALAGIVQALLITREMLFVGFSLKDENFFRIADDVRKAITGPDEKRTRKFGTALLLEDNRLLQELWSRDLNFVKLAREPETGGRSLDLFLDSMLATASTGASHLLDPNFVGVLDAGEHELSEHLRQFKRDLPIGARNSPAWAVVEAALKQLSG